MKLLLVLLSISISYVYGPKQVTVHWWDQLPSSEEDTTTELIEVRPPANIDDEGCYGEERLERVFQILQLVTIRRCQQLNRNECLMFHEAKEKCPCICRKRKYFYNPNGVRRGDEDSEELFKDDEKKNNSKEASKENGEKDLKNGKDGENGEKNGKESGKDSKGSKGKDKSSSKGSIDFGACFHGDDLVQTNKGIMTMAQLVQQKDVQALSWNTKQNELKLSPVKHWIHADPTKPAKFIQLETESGHKISLTARHVIYKSVNCSSSDRLAIFTSKISVGDCLFVNQIDEIRLSQVVKVSKEEKVGIYAPVTTEGSIIVNGVAASCFAHNEDEKLQQFVYSILFTFKAYMPAFLFNLLFGVYDNDLTVISRYLLAADHLQQLFLI